MPFDLQSARAITDEQGQGGFDLQSAKPEPMQPFEGVDPESARIVTQLNSKEITPAEGFLQATALGIEDNFASMVNMLPEQVKQTGINAAISMVNAIPEPIREAGSYVGEKIGEGYSAIKEYNPRLFENLEAAATVLATAAPAMGHSADFIKAKKVMGDNVKSDATDGILAKYKTNAAGLAVKDKKAIELMESGMDAGVIRELQIVSRGQPIKPPVAPSAAVPQQTGQRGLVSVMQPPKPPAAATAGAVGDGTQSKLLKMVQIKKKGMNEPTFRRKHRASDVLGDSVMERYRYVLNKNKEAAGKLKVASETLKGKQVDVSNPMREFAEEIKDLDIKFDDNLNPIFEGSAIEGITPAEKITKQIIKELLPINRAGGIADAQKMHKLKRRIDELVSYGKNAEGLSGNVERILKKLRNGIDTQLDNNFSMYNKVNTQYADTINALDSLQDVAGRKMDLMGKNADAAMGTLMRRLTSNAQSRINLEDAVNSLQGTAEKYGASFADDLDVQINLVNELDRVFGESAQTSIGGIMESSGARVVGAAAGGDGIAMARQVASMVGKGKKPISQQNNKLFELLEKTIKGEK